MTQRITEKHLKGMIQRLNKMTNSPLKPYTKNEDGRYVAQIGCFHLDYAYGGYNLARICNNGGGITQPISGVYKTKQELYDELYAFIRGIEFAQD